jgi:acid stress-induced BolA-like protein IbaG/YrbA
VAEEDLINPEQIKSWIRESLACEHMEVQGDGRHFEAVIVSPAFRGKSRVQQHQLVYAALGTRMQADIHALSMSTYTPEDWASRKPSAADERR